MATLDLALFQSGSPAEQALATATSAGRSIVGAEKLAQRMVLALMTTKGSLIYRPTWGTAFVTLIASRGLLTEFDVFSAFGRAVFEAGALLQSDETDDDPDDERFDSARIVNLVIATGLVTVKIVVTSVAGTTGLFELPLSFGG